jgi:hypothetical protein
MTQAWSRIEAAPLGWLLVSRIVAGMIARDRSSSQIARSASTVALASRLGGSVPTHTSIYTLHRHELVHRGFEPSVPRLRWSSVQLAARDATDAAIAKLGTPVVRVNELDERFAACQAHGRRPRVRNWLRRRRASGRRPCSPSRQCSRSVGTIGFCRQGKCQNSGRERDSPIRVEISLIADLNSLQGRKKFPVQMRSDWPVRPWFDILFCCR